MRFYLEYINHLGRLQKKSALLVSLSNHRRLQAGFTITEVLLAGLMMLIAVVGAGIGVINLLRSDYRANADSEIRNNLNRTLEFVSDEVRRGAKIIADSDNAIMNSQVPAGGRAVLAFQISDPDNPGQLLLDQIVYYTQDPENSLTGPRVLWRFGPNLDRNGNYITPTDIATWQSSPLTDMLAATANNPNCPEDFNLIAADPDDVDGFYACVRDGGGQVILNANAQVAMTTSDAVDYAASTRVSTRSTNDRPFELAAPPSSSSPTPSPSPSPGRIFRTRLVTTLPILSVPADVKAEVISGNCASCSLATGPLTSLPPGAGIPSTIQGNVGDAVVVTINSTLTNSYWISPDKVESYTSTSSTSPRTLDNNQVLLVFTTPSASYQVLLTITPR